MQYFGGKSRLGPKLAGVLDLYLWSSKGLVEPFVGGFNIVPALHTRREVICSDVHEGLICMYRAIVSGWRPPTEISEERYHALKEANDQSNPETAFAAFSCSFAGKEWDGYARNSDQTNYAAQAASRLERKRPFIERCHWRCGTYSDNEPPKGGGWLIYCDPPYLQKRGYKTGKFDHVEFYAWCETMVALGNRVLVSEFVAPAHWDEVFTHPRLTTSGTGAGKLVVEKLFEVRQKP